MRGQLTSSNSTHSGHPISFISLIIILPSPPHPTPPHPTPRKDTSTQCKSPPSTPSLATWQAQTDYSTCLHGLSTWCQGCALKWKEVMYGQQQQMTSRDDSLNICRIYMPTITVHVLNEPSRGLARMSSDYTLLISQNEIFSKWEKSFTVWLTKRLVVKYFICLTDI